MSHNVKHEQNSGFSLIELLIAIAILAMLTVPLMNSFIMSGKINRNSRRLQNAAAVAQSVAETAKHTTDKAALEAALKSLPGVYDFPADSKVNEDSPVYTFKLDGADGEKFRVNVSLMPKTDYDYKATDFADLYNEASVIYSELIVNDNKVLSLMRSQKIPYDVPGAPVMEKWNVTEGRWDSYSPSAEDKAIRDTYGNLFADEYLKSSGSLDGISESELTDVNSEFKKENIDLMSVSSHKLHGPKGVGFLYIKDKTKINPIIFGGGQQKGMRSGTENVPGIAGMALAAKLCYENFDEKIEKLYELKEYFVEKVLEIPGTTFNGKRGHEGTPHVISISFEDVRSEVLLHALEDKGIYVSSGSACSSNKPALSGTLKAIGVKNNLLDLSLIHISEPTRH